MTTTGLEKGQPQEYSAALSKLVIHPAAVAMETVSFREAYKVPNRIAIRTLFDGMLEADLERIRLSCLMEDMEETTRKDEFDDLLGQDIAHKLYLDVKHFITLERSFLVFMAQKHPHQTHFYFRTRADRSTISQTVPDFDQVMAELQLMSYIPDI